MKITVSHLFLGVTLLAAVSSSLDAQLSQQGNKLVGTGAVDPAYQGQSVSLSDDGNTALVGAPIDDGGIGAAWVYTRSGGVWSQQGNKLVGTGATGGAHQGLAVALSGDGNTAIVGGYADNTNVGAAWIFTRSGGIWSQQGNKLVGTGSAGTPLQGYSVSLSSDGNTALVGGYADNTNTGAAWVFTRTGGVWSQQGSKLVGTGAQGNANQGSSVSFSGDGNTAIVGGMNDHTGIGATWVYTRSGGVWSQQGSKLVGTGTGGVGSTLQGCSVSISSDGNTAIVGGYADNVAIGGAWIFTRSGGVWTQEGSKLLGTGSTGQARQGCAVALSSDGNIALMGGYSDNSSAGAVWEFSRSAGVWTQSGSKSVGTGVVGAAEEGKTVALSSDGSTAIIGGWNDNSSAGAAWVFAVTPLPVELSSFTATPSSRGVELNWRTETEVNNYGFEIEKAIKNDEFRIRNWNNVGFVEGSGTTNAPKEYSFIDKSMSSGKYAYRLKQIDRDGAFIYSQEVVAEISGPGVFSLDQNYPNPFNPTTVISYQLPVSSVVTLKIFDVLGREVAVLVNEQKNPGTYTAEWNAAGVSSGIYSYTLKAGGFVQTRKMLVIK